MEHESKSMNFLVHVRVWIYYGDKVLYDDFLRMVGDMFVEARRDWYNYLRIFSYIPDGDLGYVC